ncbi:MAG: 23S rRNA (guanosine(2251)-2'-O)-methyltransferase RlmB [Actinobacteria bacterium]|jgi:23S rRNA (guanosine2251-2'-O)-methyltransferase|nr:23S rRNA (guanosine(2251)-2'-O)-methyltransferase RlmB [Actinomycetota bacterium]NCW47581.1 23S rRNA (guanosine(2251)-2'-O)-methyltransferase RlmB [Actinomycetota bacterium]
MAKQPKRRALRGKGPTPRAENRPNHKKYRGGEDKKRRDVRSGDSRRDEGKRSEFGRKRVERKRIDSKRGDRKRDFRREPREHHDTIAGRNAVVEALRAGLPAKELVVAIGVDIDERLEESVKLAQKMGLGIREVERRQIENMTGIANHQGIALVAKPFQYSSQKEIFARAKEPALFVAVDGVTDPRNIGAIARSAAAFGADGLLIPERRNAPLTAAAWKSSAGAAARLPIAQVTNLVRSMQDAKEFGCFIVGLDGDADTAVEEIEIADQPIYMVVGSEGRGLSRLVRENCDLLIKIPMSNTVESLNASVAMSIALYAVDRKRHAI